MNHLHRHKCLQNTKRYKTINNFSFKFCLNKSMVHQKAGNQSQCDCQAAIPKQLHWKHTSWVQTASRQKHASFLLIIMKRRIATIHTIIFIIYLSFFSYFLWFGKTIIALVGKLGNAAFVQFMYFMYCCSLV